MPFIFNGESPKILTYNGNDVLKFISRIGGANDLIWQKASITAPSNLKVNGAASSTSSSCKLTWDAATVTGSDSGITYHIYKDGTEYATTTGTSYTFSASEITGWSNVSFTVAAYNEDAGYSSQTADVTFTYKAPASISSPYNLKVNGLSSDTDSYCNLTWSAATLSNASGGITYYIYKDGTQVATTTDTSYSFSASTIANWSGASLKVDAYNSEAGWSGYSNTVTFTYKEPVTLSAPSNLKVNGATSSSNSVCKLTWSAATLSGATGTITYHIYKDGTDIGNTTSTSYTVSASTITGWQNARLTVKAYNSSAGYSAASNAVTFTYKVMSTTVTVSASKYATTDNSSFANSGGTSCIVGRSTKSTPVGTAMKFNAPSGGWSQFSKAVLHVQRTGGSASATVQVGKLNVAYSTTLYTTEFYYGNYGTSIGSANASAATSWFSLDISSALPSGSGELGITLTSTNAYAAVDGTNAYISLSN